jgi:excisionase family DNA binding protein
MTSSQPARRPRGKGVQKKDVVPARPEDELLTTAQVAQLLHLSTRSVLNFIQDGVLPAHRLPGTRQFLIWRRDVVAVVEASRVNPADVADSDADDRSVTGAE